MATSMRRFCQTPLVISAKWRITQISVRTASTRRSRKAFSGSPNKGTRDVPAFSCYKDMVAYHRAQADRSLLVSMGGQHTEVYKICQQHGRVAAVFPFSINQKDYALVEMASSADLKSVMNSVGQFPNKEKIPVQTRFLYMRAGAARGATHCPSAILNRTKSKPEEKEMLNSLKKCRSIRDQVSQLHVVCEMSELGSRLRLLLCSILEETLRGTLPSCSVSPFGSSVNFFGRHDCDLDLILEMDDDTEVEPRSSQSALVYLSKMKQENNRLQSQLTLDTIGGILSHFTPQIVHVRRILKARVPIVKFRHIGTGIECDLSIGNRSAVYMSELLYVYGQLDQRVRPLVFTIRHWAKVNDITRSNPGPWLSNFMLTWMVIYFLQVRDVPVVPSIAQLRKLAGPGDRKVLEEEDVGFLTDWSQFPLSNNTESVEGLLLDFFKFYAHLDLSQVGISLVDANTFHKPEPDVPLHLENPLEQSLNASKNISSGELAKFQSACDAAANALSTSTRSRPGGGSEWGLLAILSGTETKVSDDKLNVSMTNLFSDHVDNTEHTDSADFPDVSTPITGSYTEQSECGENTEDNITDPELDDKTSATPER